MPHQFETQYVSVRATPEIVGRKAILTQIRAAIEADTELPTVFYITAWGGRGKTRLVETILERLNSFDATDSWHSPQVLAATRLVDLYHLHTHSEEGVIHEMYEVLDAGTGLFIQYLKERTELNRVKHDLSEILREVTRQREKMFAAFLEDFNQLRRRFRKVVFALDTAETLVYETDRVQQALGLTEAPIGVAGWLVREFLPKAHNSVILIAGRPETPQLLTELRRLEGTIRLIEYELQDFDEMESLQYFEAVAQATRSEDPHIAELIARIPEETRRVIHLLAGGQPFLISLIIDYFVVTNEFIREVDMSLEEAKEITGTTVGIREVQEKLKEVIIQGIQEARRPLDAILLALSWMPKGMGALSLAWVLKRGQPTEEEIQAAQGYIQLLREPQNRLSFVKIRADNELVFFQDELYTLFARVHARYPPEKKRKIYTAILDYYHYQIQREGKHIKELLEKHLAETLPSYGVTLTDHQLAGINLAQEELRQARTRFQSYLVEQVYYLLRVNPSQGFERYFEYAEEAFRNNEPDLWLPLRDELLRFAKRYEQEGVREIGGLSLADIQGDIGIRWIKNNIAQGQYAAATEQIKRFQETCPDLLEFGTFNRLHLLIWERWNHVYSGVETKNAEEFLQGVLAELHVLPDERPFDKWRKQLLQAHAHSTLGYLYRSRGQFHKAIPQYREALPLWRALKIPAEQANTLNNLAWALAEVGDFKAALIHCKDGLQLRRKLGRRFTLALSLNTLGLIETRNNQPTQARFRCERALAIFRGLEQSRGEGLACIALAEALRRITNVPELLSEEQALQDLELAENHAQKAVTIFSELFQEPLRLVEASIELGCTCREWVRRLPSDNERRTKLFEKGEAALRSAVSVSTTEFTYRAVDALVNLAWLYYYVGEVEKATHVLTKEVREMLPDEYLLTTQHGPLEIEEAIPWYWVQLGKADVLLGRIAFDNHQTALQMQDLKSAEHYLRVAAHNWTLSLAYNARYGINFRDLNYGMENIYKCMSSLNEDEIGWVRNSMRQTFEEYHIPEELQLFDGFIEERFGY